jgi:hypothetical protein
MSRVLEVLHHSSPLGQRPSLARALSFRAELPDTEIVQVTIGGIDGFAAREFETLMLPAGESLELWLHVVIHPPTPQTPVPNLRLVH